MTKTFYPPGPMSRLPGDQYFAFRRNPLRLLMRVARDYGDLAHFQIGLQRVFLLNHPDLIRDVLVTHHENFTKGRALQRAKSLLGEGLLTSEGELHQRQRQLIQPAFHRAQMAKYATVMLEYGARVNERWEEGQTLDIAEEMRRLTLAIVAKTLFGADVEAEVGGEVVMALTRAMRRLELLARPPTLPLIIESLKKRLIAGRRRSPKVRELLDATIHRFIAERRQSDTDHDDLLSMLLHAKDEESGDRMTDQQLRDEVMTFFIAGHETTANAMAWAWYVLSQHPEVETKLYKELDEVLAGKPGAADLAQLHYVGMVFTETLRLYPPSWILGRLAISDYRINDYVIPAGALILMSPYVMHHDARYYPDPFRFDPERWRPEAREARPQFSYFPFGGGARRCIGEGFAWMEGVLLIATLAREWRMRLVSSSPIEPQPFITLRPKPAMLMRLERRESTVGSASSPSEVRQSKPAPAN